MRPLTVYVANDDSRFDTEGAAVAREELIAMCAEATAFLVPKPPNDGCAFFNGNGYRQQPTGSREKLWAFLQSQGVNRDCSGPIGELLHRMHCIDLNDREWGQPYFALNPGKGKMVAL